MFLVSVHRTRGKYSPSSAVSTFGSKKRRRDFQRGNLGLPLWLRAEGTPAETTASEKQTRHANSYYKMSAAITTIIHYSFFIILFSSPVSPDMGGGTKCRRGLQSCRIEKTNHPRKSLLKWVEATTTINFLNSYPQALGSFCFFSLFIGEILSGKFCSLVDSAADGLLIHLIPGNLFCSSSNNVLYCSYNIFILSRIAYC